MKKYLLLGSICFPVLSLFAQNNTPWRGKKCAVVITYDDAISQHLDNAIPVLDSLGLKATFYITGYSPAFRERLVDWKKVAANGHELGNHTLFHPCIGNLPGREWVKPDYDLSKYTIQRIVDETRVNNELLQAVDGKTKRTFAYPCADTKIGDSFYIAPLKNDFAAVRTVRAEMHRIDQVDLNNVDCYMVSGQTGAQLIEWVKKAMETQSLLVVLFHGVGGGNSLDVSLSAHRQFLQYIKQNEKDIWVTPMIEVAGYIKDFQNRKSIRRSTEQDYKDMLAKLNITSIRPGANGNGPDAPAAASYDEAKRNSFPNLPDPLVFRDVGKVSSPKMWYTAPDMGF